MIYVLYGQPGSGKTTMSNMLADHLPQIAHIIDGDQLRRIAGNYDYTRRGRENNITKANRIATKAHCADCDVIMALVNPYKHLRDQLRVENPGEVTEILLTTKRNTKKEFHVSDFDPGSPEICLNTDREELLTFQSLIYMLDNYDIYP